MQGSGGIIRVLVADDDEDIRSLVTDVIAGHESMEIVGTANDGEEAVKRAEELKPDLVVMDWAMPGGGGDRATQQITATQPETKILAISAYEPSQASYVMGTAGSVGFLAKPFTPKDLIEAIESATRW